MSTHPEPDVARACARMDEYLAALAKAGEPQQKVVGQGMNAASAFLIQEFGSVPGFREAQRASQDKFLERLNAMVRKLEPSHTGLAWGMRVFWIYARLLMEEDPQVASRYWPEVARLGRMGASLGDAPVPGA